MDLTFIRKPRLLISSRKGKNGIGELLGVGETLTPDGINDWEGVGDGVFEPVVVAVIVADVVPVDV